MIRTRLAGERVYVFTSCRWLKLLGADGMALYRCMFFRAHRTKVQPVTFGHELEHVLEWVAVGLFVWPARHLVDLIANGYRKSRAEVRAYAMGPINAQRGDVIAFMRVLHSVAT